MVGMWSRRSLRLENFAGMVWPNEPIGPDGGGSLAASALPGAPGVPWVLVPVVAAASKHEEGCLDTGVISAERASSGVGMFSAWFDCDHGCGSTPGLIWPVPGTRPGLVGLGPGSAPFETPIDVAIRMAAILVPTGSENLF